MSNLPNSMITVLSRFASMFSLPSFENLQLLFRGHVLSNGRRTVAAILRRMDLKNIKNFSKYHGFFSKAIWSPLEGSRILFELLIELIQGEIEIHIDSTIERRKGSKIKGSGMQRDAVRSTKSRKVLVPGLNWLVCSIRIKLPWCTHRSWSLPFLTIKLPPEEPLSTSRNEHDLTNTRRHKTMTKWVCQIICLLRRWVGPSRKISIVGDSAFAAYEIANTCINFNVSIISRMRLDARTFEFPCWKKRGRKPLVGKRLPIFKEILDDKKTVWETIEVAWYGEKRKKIECVTGRCLWYGYGIRPVPIKWVLTRDGVVIFTTDVNKSTEDIIESFVSRWGLEVTFEESRRHLGLETQRQWSDPAIDRITPCILSSFSIIILMVLEIMKTTKEDIPLQISSWYKKTHVTFSDVLAYLRKCFLEEMHFPQFDKNTDLWKCQFRAILDHLSAV